MLTTLCHIPHEISGIPVFGWGWGLWTWCVISGGLLLWLYFHAGGKTEAVGYLPVLAVIAVALRYVLPNLEEVTPQGVKLGVPIRGYGMMLLLGVLAGVTLAAHRARRMGIHPDHIYSLAFWLFLGGIVGARLYYVVEYWDQFRGNSMGHVFTPWETIRQMVNVTQGGLVVYGSLIGGFIASVAYIYNKKLPLLAMGDLIAPSLMIGLALGRIGCLLNGCCFGQVCQLPWSHSFPKESPPYLHQLERGQLHGLTVSKDATGRPVVETVFDDSPADRAGVEPSDCVVSVGGDPVRAVEDVRFQPGIRDRSLEIEKADGRRISLTLSRLPPWSYPVHPTQLYSAINALLICFFLLAYYPFRWRDGEVIALCLTIYPVSRFLLEIIRPGDSTAWLVSVLLVLAVAALWGYISRQPRGSVLPV